MTKSTAKSQDQSTGAGRPRDPRVDQVILKSTLKLLSDRGYFGFSVEQVAADAGVGKTTIYRRYPSKEELAAAAVASLREEIGPPPDTGNTRQDLVEMIMQRQSVFERGPGYAMIGALLVEEQRNPDLIRVFRERILWPRSNEITDILQRGVERGEVRGDADLEMAVQTIVGSIIAGHIVGFPATRERAERVVDAIWDGLGCL